MLYKKAKSLIVLLKRKIYWYFQEWLWCLPKPCLNFLIGGKNNLQVTIAIYTYIERFESCFKKTLLMVERLFPENQILVVANGHFETGRQMKYLDEISKYCSQYKTVRLIAHQEPVGTSVLTNEAIMNSDNKKTWFINDDMRCSVFLKREVLKSGLFDSDIGVVNKSWGFLYITNKITDKIGFFDERLPEIGGEDDDYAARCALEQISVPFFTIKGMVPSPKKTRKRDIPNSWGKIMSSEKGGYSTLNFVFLLEKKWETSDEPFEGAIFVPNRRPKYWKLRHGIETANYIPDFTKMHYNE